MTLYRVQAQWHSEPAIAVHFPGSARREAARFAEALFAAGYRVSMSEDEPVSFGSEQ